MMNTINTIQDVESFACKLANDFDLIFHPDNDFSEYINVATKVSVFSQDEALLLNLQMKKCFEICNTFDEDIYELMGRPLMMRLRIGKYAAD